MRRAIAKPGGHELRERQCAVLSCRVRSGLIPTKTFVPGLLVQVDLCHSHEAKHTATIHAKFREEFGLDFVDPERQ